MGDSATITTPAAKPVANSITTADIRTAFSLGVRDFKSAPAYGLFFGVFYAGAGWLIIALLLLLDINYYVWPMATGFAMVAPFVAAGLYDVSRRLERDEPLSWNAVLTSVRTGGGHSLGWMVLVTTFAYIIWLDIAIALYVIFYGLEPLSFSNLVVAIFTTPKGMAFFLLGNLLGAVLGTAVFSISAISFPLLFDRDVDFVTAMITSVKLVTGSPKPMLMWCLIITALLGVSLVTVFVGLLVVLPILGHSTWHLYRRGVRFDDAA